MTKGKRLIDVKLQAERWIDLPAVQDRFNALSLRENRFAGYMVGYRAGLRARKGRAIKNRRDR